MPPNRDLSIGNQVSHPGWFIGRIPVGSGGIHSLVYFSGCFRSLIAQSHRADLIISLGPPFRLEDERESVALIYPPTCPTRKAFVASGAGIAVRFMPGAHSVLLGEVSGNAPRALRDFSLPWSRLMDAAVCTLRKDFQQGVKQLLALWHKPSVEMHKGLKLLNHFLSLAPDSSISRSAAMLDVSASRLRAIAMGHTGMTPKRLRRVQRVRGVLRAMDAGHRIEFHRFGYADYSHMSHELRDFCNMSPVTARRAVTNHRLHLR